VQHLPSTATPDEVAAILAEDAVVIVDDAAEPALLARIEAEMQPYIDANRFGADEFSGFHTSRTGGLIARSPAARELVMHPLALGTCNVVLGHATSFQLHLTQIIAIGPDEPAQTVHRDQWAFDFFPFPNGFEVQCNTIWALDDFTEENGATRVIPGSHRLEDKLRFTNDDTVPAEMSRGSVVFYTGALYHGGGANRSNGVRRGINITYHVPWLLRQEN